MKNAFDIVRDFEQAVAKYTGAPYCVAVSSCTAAIFTCCMWETYNGRKHLIYIPKKTYIGVAQSIINSGQLLRFRDEQWSGAYDINPIKVSDSAKRFTSNMYKGNDGWKICTSHHWQKILSLGHGGCILHDNKEFDIWARKFRFDGRTEGIKASEDINPIRGYHLYLLPELAAAGLVRLHHLPKHNPDLSNDDYPDLSQMDIFK
jgi:dTDP-4-amino-4,6-dideoxygalactose transaminase